MNMAEKEGAIVEKGHDQGMKLAVSVLEEFNLPLGLLPFENVNEVGFDGATGYLWIVMEKKLEHNFKMAGKLVSYETEVNGYIEKGRFRKLKGVKAKELLMWLPVNEIAVDQPSTGKIRFKSLAGITKTFPVEAFAAGQ